MELDKKYKKQGKLFNIYTTPFIYMTHYQNFKMKKKEFLKKNKYKLLLDFLTLKLLKENYLS